jgi:hypothetical protein
MSESVSLTMPCWTGGGDGVPDVLACPLAEISERQAPTLKSNAQRKYLNSDAVIISYSLTDASHDRQPNSSPRRPPISKVSFRKSQPDPLLSVPEISANVS